MYLCGFRWKPPTNVTAFTSTSYSSHTLAVAATVPEIALLNAATGSVVRTSPAATVINQMDFSPSLLLAGCMDGYLRAYDPRTALTPNSGPSAVRAHSNSVQGVQVSGNEVFTIGISMRCAILCAKLTQALTRRVDRTGRSLISSSKCSIYAN